jgi:hypothetical protein
LQGCRIGLGDGLFQAFAEEIFDIAFQAPVPRSWSWMGINFPNSRAVFVAI